MADWISVEDRMPEVEREVLVFCKIKPSGDSYQCQAFYVPERTVDMDGSTFNWDFEACDYEEESDTYWVREGWWERIYNWDDYGAVAIGDFVTHWMQLPAPPKTLDHTCSTCRWYAPFEGVCCNGDSEHRADYVGADETCPEWERTPTHDLTHECDSLTHGCDGEEATNE